MCSSIQSEKPENIDKTERQTNGQKILAHYNFIKAAQKTSKLQISFETISTQKNNMIHW